ncbi:hypothetical protein PR048_012856 [Dryococelus australis]|uniref:Uncharacterized protein n=1 Tax=Dryococelus australis TaxID=614101 RepID=A0ABQ9HRC3_9NEOP|nr:hypothetical protein PR048_012856 [Dryococelus australis]
MSGKTQVVADALYRCPVLALYQGLVGQLNQEIARDEKYAKETNIGLFVIQNGIQFRRKEIGEEQWLLCIPNNVSGELCVKAHEECGHFVITKTVKFI